MGDKGSNVKAPDMEPCMEKTCADRVAMMNRMNCLGCRRYEVIAIPEDGKFTIRRCGEEDCLITFCTDPRDSSCPLATVDEIRAIVEALCEVGGESFTN